MHNPKTEEFSIVCYGRDVGMGSGRDSPARQDLDRALADCDAAAERDQADTAYADQLKISVEL